MKLISKNTLTDSVGLGAGAVGARFVSNKFLSTQNNWIKNGAPIVLGAIIASNGGESGTKRMIKHAGYGMIAQGAGNLIGGLLGMAGIDGLSDTNTLLGDVDQYGNEVMGDAFGVPETPVGDTLLGTTTEMDY